MTAFAHPSVLALAGLALLAWLWVRHDARRRRAALRFPASSELARSAPSLAARLARGAPAGLAAAALVLLAVALARPQKVTRRGAAATGQGLDIMLVLDTSHSMSALDFDPDRLGAAKETALRFVRGRVHDRIGVVVFGGAPMLACPLTVDYDAVAERLAGLEPGMTATDGTAVGDGIVSGLNHLKGGDAKSKVMIVLTDGRSNTGAIDPLTAARAAATLGVKLYTIGTAKRGSTMMPVEDPLRGRVLVRIDDDLDEDLLLELARLTDGRYFRAQSLGELREIYATIDKLEKSDIKLPDLVSRQDLYRGPLLAAVLLLLAQAALANTWLLRWP